MGTEFLGMRKETVVLDWLVLCSEVTGLGSRAEVLSLSE